MRGSGLDDVAGALQQRALGRGVGYGGHKKQGGYDAPSSFQEMSVLY